MFFYVLPNDQNEEEMVAHSGKSVEPTRAQRQAETTLLEEYLEQQICVHTRQGFVILLVAIYLTEIWIV